MAQYSKDLDENLENKVKTLAVTYGLANPDVEVWALRLNKIGKDVGEVVKGNDLLKMKAGKNVVAIALLEEAFQEVDEPTQNIWIESLLSQVYYDGEKEKVIIEKPEIAITAGMYNKYGDVAVNKAVLAQLTLEQLREEEKERKEQEKLAKKEKKSKKN